MSHQFDVPGGDPNQCDPHSELQHELKGGIWNGVHAWTIRRWQSRVSPSNLREPLFVPIDAGAGLDFGSNSLVNLADSDSNFAVAEQVFVPQGTVTFRVGEVSTTTTMVISFIASVPLV